MRMPWGEVAWSGDAGPFEEQTPWSLFGVHPLPDEDGPIRMLDGSWRRDDEGHFSVASMGVIADHVTAQGTVVLRPPQFAGLVTSELNLDIVPGVEPVGTIYGSWEPVGEGAGSALASGRFVDETGQTVAVGTTGVAFFPAPPDAPEVPRATPRGIFGETRPVAGVSVDDILGMSVTLSESGAVGRVVSKPWHLNPADITHGGVTFAFLEYVGHAALGGWPWQATSVRVSYLRPGQLGEELTSTAEVVYRGRSLAVVYGRLTRPDGKDVAVSMTTYRRVE